MAEFSALDAVRSRRDPGLQSRALRLLLAMGIACCALAAGVFVAVRVAEPAHAPLFILFGVVGPLATGLLMFATASAVAFHPVIACMLPRLALPIFLGGVVGVVVLPWVFAMLFGLMDRIVAVDTQSAGAVVHTAFDGPVTTVEIASYLATGGVSDVSQSSQGLASFGGYLLWPLQFQFVRDVLGLFGVLGFISLVAMFGIWWERKVAGRIQSRLGPMRVGGWHGWAQSMADGIKLLQKEDLCQEGADRPLFKLAPYLTFVPVLSAFVALPFSAAWVFRDLDVGLIFILAMMGVSVVGVLLAGWASNNKWSVYGAMREACQMVSYEIPMGMSLLIPVMTAGTLRLTKIGELQQDGFHSWLAFSNPFTFIAALTYFTASLANCKRAPFDLPEAESELVSGYHTEYSGFRWSLFFFAEYSEMFVVSALAVTLFFGAWYSPIPASWGAGLAGGAIWERALYGVLFNGPIWFILKAGFFFYVQIWLRWTLPRVRLDQVMYACVQVLLPLTMIVLLGNTLWVLFVAPGSLTSLIVQACLSAIGAVLVAGFIAIMLYGFMNRRRLVGTLAIDHLPGA